MGASRVLSPGIGPDAELVVGTLPADCPDGTCPTRATRTAPRVDAGLARPSAALARRLPPGPEGDSMVSWRRHQLRRRVSRGHPQADVVGWDTHSGKVADSVSGSRVFQPGARPAGFRRPVGRSLLAGVSRPWQFQCGRDTRWGSVATGPDKWDRIACNRVFLPTTLTFTMDASDARLHGRRGRGSG